MAGPGCVDFLGAPAWRRRDGEPDEGTDARAPRFVGDPRIEIVSVLQADEWIEDRPRFLGESRSRKATPAHVSSSGSCSCPPPLLEVSLEQASVLIRFVNVVVRGPV